MVLAICIENSNLILCGTSHHRKLFQSYLRTELEGTADEYAISIRSILDLHGLSGSNIEGVILSSVVPPLASVVKQAVKKLTKANILVVGPGIKTGLNLRIENPAQLGADRVCNAVAALKKYPAPIMVVDMNTTTTVSVLNEKKMFIGGCIIPGVSSSLEALCTTAAQLPQISIEECPDSIIGSNNSIRYAGRNSIWKCLPVRWINPTTSGNIRRRFDSRGNRKTSGANYPLM